MYAWHRSLGRRHRVANQSNRVVEVVGHGQSNGDGQTIRRRDLSTKKYCAFADVWDVWVAFASAAFILLCYYQTHGIERTTVKPTSQPNKRKGSRTEPRYDRMASAQVGRSVALSRIVGCSAGRPLLVVCFLMDIPADTRDERRRGPRVLHSVRPAHSPPHPFGLSSAFGNLRQSAGTGR